MFGRLHSLPLERHHGYASTNTIRTVTAPFPTGNSPMLVRPNHAPEIHMQVDIARMFSSPYLIKLADTYRVMGARRR